MHIRGGSRRVAIASAAFLRRHGYYSKSAAKFGENEAKSDCGYRFGHKEQEMQEYFLSLLFLLHFVAKTKSSYREQMHSHAGVVYNSFWFRGAGIGLATKNRRCRSISYLSCFSCTLWLKQNLRTMSRCIATHG